jgi:two-component system NtrC family response regulator
MREALARARLVAAHPTTVLITGESGSGKEVLAREIHRRSPRAHRPLLQLNCVALPEQLVESELFGHERGAFSDARERKLGLVEIADGGTLFLDEIADLGLGAQAKLLTFLEQRTFRRVGSTSIRRVDARVVAATNRDLKAMVAAKTLREDLFYRLDSIGVRLPPLRDRPADVPALAAHFLQVAAREFGRRFTAVAPEALGLLARYRWPGNVRELRAVITRSALMHDDDVLRANHLPAELVAAALTAPATGGAAGGAPGRTGETSGAAIPSLEAVELAHFRRGVDICQGNRTLAAQHLGITRQTLAKKIGVSE